MSVNRKRNLNKSRGTYQVTFSKDEKEFVELLLRNNEGAPRFYVSQLITDLLKVAKYHYFNNKEKFVEHYGLTFLQDYFSNLNK